MPFVQLAPGKPPVRRWSSWYDPRLVTQAGEDILTALDTFGIAELRKHKLIWSSWGINRNLGELHHRIDNTAWGIRKIENIDPNKMRLFLLSLLWRAAATDIAEFSEVCIPPNDLERLRLMISFGNVEPLSFYPVQLTQLSTMGIIHNYAPNSDTKLIPSFAPGVKATALPIFRFYFDGLIIHFHSQESDNGFTASSGNLVAGAGSTLLVTTQTYEDSLHSLLLKDIIVSAVGTTLQTKC